MVRRLHRLSDVCWHQPEDAIEGRTLEALAARALAEVKTYNAGTRYAFRGYRRTPFGRETAERLARRCDVGETTGISWTESTWNPVRGCAPVSPGCAHCYAAAMASRFCGPGRPYEGLASGGKWTGAARFIPEMLDLPLRWRKPRRVFVNSMSDLFHEDVTDEQIAAVFGVMAAATQHTFQVLTKRPRRMVEWFRWADNFGHPHEGVAAALCLSGARFSSPKGRRDRLENLGPGWPWPLPNVWIGVTAEDQARADERIPLLLQTPAAVRFVSCEPLLGPVELPRIDQSMDPSYSPLDWVIVGAESGPRARPCSVEWVRSLVRQCQSAALRQDGGTMVPVFVKQIRLADGRLSHDPAEWPEDLRVQEWPPTDPPTPVEVVPGRQLPWFASERREKRGLK